MFNNIGSKIKTLVKVFFWLAVIGGVIGGALVCKMSQSPLGLLVAGAIILVAWLGSFVMYGYGELIDSTQENTYYLKEIYNQLSKSNLNTGSGEQLRWQCLSCQSWNENYSACCTSCGTKRGTKNQSATDLSVVGSDVIYHGKLDTDNRWKCSKCGKENKMEAMACNCCGTRRP